MPLERVKSVSGKSGKEKGREREKKRGRERKKEKGREEKEKGVN